MAGGGGEAARGSHGRFHGYRLVSGSTQTVLAVEEERLPRELLAVAVVVAVVLVVVAVRGRRHRGDVVHHVASAAPAASSASGRDGELLALDAPSVDDLEGDGEADEQHQDAHGGAADGHVERRDGQLVGAVGGVLVEARRTVLEAVAPQSGADARVQLGAPREGKRGREQNSQHYDDV